MHAYNVYGHVCMHVDVNHKCMHVCTYVHTYVCAYRTHAHAHAYIMHACTCIRFLLLVKKKKTGIISLS